MNVDESVQVIAEMSLDVQVEKKVREDDVLEPRTERTIESRVAAAESLNIIPAPAPRDSDDHGPTSTVTNAKHRRDDIAAVGVRFHRPPRLRIRTSPDHPDIHAPVMPTVVLDPDQLPDFYPTSATLTTPSTSHDTTNNPIDNDDTNDSARMQAAFDNRYDVYMFYRDPPVLPLMSPSLVQNSFMLWREAVQTILADLDRGRPLSRVICVALHEDRPSQPQSQSLSQSLPQPLSSLSLSQTHETLADSSVVVETGSDPPVYDGLGAVCGVVIDLLAVKRYTLPSRTTPATPDTTSTAASALPLPSASAHASSPTTVSNPVIFVRYAPISRCPGVFEAVAASARELPYNGACQKTVFCTRGEIAWALHTLAAQAGCVDEAYRRRWAESNRGSNSSGSRGSGSGSGSGGGGGSGSAPSSPQDTAHPELVFALSCLRPTDEPWFPFEEAERERRRERAVRKQARADARQARDAQIREGKVASKRATAERRRLRCEREQREVDERLAVVKARKAEGDAMNRTCDQLGCEEIALIQCARCRQTVYCREQREFRVDLYRVSVCMCVTFHSVIDVLQCRTVVSLRFLSPHVILCLPLSYSA